MGVTKSPPARGATRPPSPEKEQEARRGKKLLFAKMPGGSSLLEASRSRRAVQEKAGGGFLRERLTRSAISLAATRRHVATTKTSNHLRKNLSHPLKGATWAIRDSYCS